MTTRTIFDKLLPEEIAKAEIQFRAPGVEDGLALNQLVAECPPLDPNSLYCNLLQCTHFSSTSVVATDAGRLVGFITGYIVPDDPRTLFIWQVGVTQSVRKRNLARRMLSEILRRPGCLCVKFLHTTITPDNQPSRALFTGFAHALDATLVESTWFEKQRHFGDAHPDEILLQIGPISRTNVINLAAE